MSYLQRFNEKTGRKEFYIEPEGLPGYWTALGLCDRCNKYNKCLGLASFTEKEWLEFEDTAKTVLKISSTVVKKMLFFQEKCNF